MCITDRDYKIKRAPQLCEMEMWNVHEILMIDPATHTDARTRRQKGWTMQRAMVATTIEPLSTPTQCLRPP